MRSKSKILKSKVFTFVLLIGLVLAGQISAQQRSIQGVVVDWRGLPLPGVTVVVKGTIQGTVTNTDGNYSLTGLNDAVTLIFSFVGMKSQEVAIGAKSKINVTMVEETIGLDEVVAVGYGTQSARNVTGSISKIKMAETENLPNANVTQALRGRVAGIQFTDNGRPGQSGSILIRGPISLSASNSPLIVLDGIIFNGSITDVNPNDMASMEVLKDASATAIYGSRAANGVILLTSKKGISDKPTIRFNTFHGISDFSYKVKILDKDRWIEEKVDVQRELGKIISPTDVQNLGLGSNEIDNILAGKWIDPWEEGSQDAGISSYDLSVFGKSEKTNYFLSGSWTDEKGLIKNDQLKRLSLRSNIEIKIKDWLTTGTNSLFVNKDNSGVIVNIDDLVQSSPYGTWWREDGTPTEYVVEGETVAANPVLASYYRSNEVIENNLFSNFYTLIDVPFIKGLSYRLNYSANLRWSHNYSYERQNKHLANNTTWAKKYNRNAFDWVMENIINYKKQINKHYFDVTLMYGRNHTFFENTTASSERLSVYALGWNDLNLGETQTTFSYGEKTEGVSYMFRVNYNLLNRYLFTLTARKDGSSVFAENNKYGTFPSGSFAWIVSDESFLKKVEFINLLKMRLSYGAVGNQAIKPYQSLSLLETSQYVFGTGSTSLGVYPGNMANTDLKWETTYTTNLGIDFNIFKSRISGTIELYNMKTKDLLVDRSLPEMTGFSSVLTNIGEVNNKGIEITLNTLNIVKNKFEWYSTLTFSRNINKIVHLYYTDTDGDGKEDDDLGNDWFIGQPITVYYDYVFDGIYQEGDVLPLNTKSGDVRLKDLYEDGIIDSRDRKIIGQGGQPKYKWGFANNFKYGNFALSIFINSMQGWISNFPLIFRGSTQQRSLNWVDTGWWTPENKSNTASSLLYQNKYGHGWYESRDFIRIQDVALSYDVPKSLINKWNISTFKLYVSGKNLKTFTDWRGSDPEIGGGGGGRAFGGYPMSKTVSIGLNIEF